MSRNVRASSGKQWEESVPQQLSIDYDPALAARHRSLKECIATCVYGQRGGLTSVAAQLDMSPSHLSEILAGGGERNRKLDVDVLEAYMSSYDDITPILYLVSKFMPDHGEEQAHAHDRLRAILQELPDLVASTRTGKATRRDRR